MKSSLKIVGMNDGRMCDVGHFRKMNEKGEFGEKFVKMS